jgi:hypothetical protein
MRTVDIAYKKSFNPFFPIGAKRFCNHVRPEITSADADVNDVFYFLPV